MHNNYEINTKEKYQAILIGCAIGDTVGMPVEGWKREQIKKYVGRIEKPIAPFRIFEDGKIVEKDEYGKIKYYNHILKKGQYTDDTILTLAIAESLVQKKAFDINDIAKRQVEVYDITNEIYGPENSGFGQTTRDAFEKLKKGIKPEDSGVIGGAGTGPAMKMSPIGIYMHATGRYSQGLEYAKMISKMTHLDPRSIIGGMMQADAIYNLLNDVSKEEFIKNIYAVSKMEEEISQEFSHRNIKMQDKMSWIIENHDANDEQAYKILGNNSIVWKSYPFTIFMFQKYWNEPIKGLIETINYGGDCDTTGAIYGTLIGAKHGMIFPKEWIDVIENKEKIFRIGKDMGDLK